MRNPTQHAYLALFLVAGLAGGLGARCARAQDVGTVVAVEGTVEIGHAGAWTPAAVGAIVQRGDEIRTTRPGGRVRILSIGDSELNIGAGTDVGIDEVVFDPPQKTVRSRVRLLSGKMRPVVGAEYKQRGALYEITTATAVVKVRGTEFVVAYDPVAEVSDVVGVSGQVEVRGATERPNTRGVFVTTKELTTVAKGKPPTMAKSISDALFRQYIEDLEFIGGGQAESQAAKHPILAGDMVPPLDQVEQLPAVAGAMAPAVRALVPLVGPPSESRQPPWPLIVTAPGDEFFGAGRTLGGIIGGPPGASRTTGDIGIKY